MFVINLTKKRYCDSVKKFFRQLSKISKGKEFKTTKMFTTPFTFSNNSSQPDTKEDNQKEGEEKSKVLFGTTETVPFTFAKFDIKGPITFGNNQVSTPEPTPKAIVEEDEIPPELANTSDDKVSRLFSGPPRIPTPASNDNNNDSNNINNIFNFQKDNEKKDKIEEKSEEKEIKSNNNNLYFGITPAPAISLEKLVVVNTTDTKKDKEEDNNQKEKFSASKPMFSIPKVSESIETNPFSSLNNISDTQPSSSFLSLFSNSTPSSSTPEISSSFSFSFQTATTPAPSISTPSAPSNSIGNSIFKSSTNESSSSSSSSVSSGISASPFSFNFGSAYNFSPTDFPFKSEFSHKKRKRLEKPILTSTDLSPFEEKIVYDDNELEEEKIERKVWSECFLCEEEYSKDIRMIEECLHSYCKECIEQKAETSKICPICHVPLPSPLSSLPINYPLIHWRSLSPHSSTYIINKNKILNDDNNNENCDK